MANPIIPVGSSRARSGDIFDNARQQDMERRIREDEEYFQRTGVNRPPRREVSPLVDDDRPDVATDGDTYDENYRAPNPSAYVEDSPSRIYDTAQRDILTAHGVNMARSTPRSEREAFVQRERVKQDKETQIKIEKHKGKFNNAINGLALDEE